MRMLRLALLWLVFCSPVFAQVGQIPGHLQPVVSGGSCSGWTPATPSGLLAAYDADVGVTGSPVTAWADQSGHSNTANPNGFTGPVVGTIGGKTGLVFAGGNATGLRTTADSVTIGTGSASSVFMLGSFSGSSGDGGPYVAGNGQVNTATSAANSWAFGLNGSGLDIEAIHASGSFATTSAALNTELRLGIILDGTNATAYVNNVAGTPAALSFSFTSPGSIGVASGAFAGTIRLLYFYSTALGSTDRGCMDAYLVSRE